MSYAKVPSIVSVEKFSDFGDDEYRMSMRLDIEKRMEQGLLSKEAILQKFTDHVKLSERGAKNYADIKTTFDSIIVHEEDYQPEDLVISKSKFVSRFAKSLGTFYPYAEEGLSVLLDCTKHYGAYPFQVEKSSPLTVEHFTRAVAFMLGSNVYREDEQVTPADVVEPFLHGVYSGGIKLGPYTQDGQLERERSKQDRRRNDFRSLAVPRLAESSTTLTEAEKRSMTIKVNYLTYDVFNEDTVEGSEEYWASRKEVHIVHGEDERSVDLLDVLVVVFAHWWSDYFISLPHREVWHPVLRTSPHYEFYLHQLEIPSTKFFEYIKILMFAQLKNLVDRRLPQLQTKELVPGFEAVSQCMINAVVDKETGSISWEAFDEVIGKSMPLLFCGLSELADILLHPSTDFPALNLQPTFPQSILTYPIMAQIATFDPDPAAWIYVNELDHLYSHNSGQTSSSESLTEIMKLWDRTVLLLIQGHKIAPAEGEEDTTYIFGTLRRFPWYKEVPTLTYSEIAIPNIIFQLSPVHRVYRARDPEARLPKPNSADNGLAFGRALDDSDFSSEAAEPRGTTSFILNKTLDQAVFEHGKADAVANEGEFEGFCPFGIREEGVVEIKVDKIDVWWTSDTEE